MLKSGGAVLAHACIKGCSKLWYLGFVFSQCAGVTASDACKMKELAATLSSAASLCKLYPTCHHGSTPLDCCCADNKASIAAGQCGCTG